ncbi:MAG: hypothetical protein WCT77_11725 [Bacteroidota bacterium]
MWDLSTDHPDDSYIRTVFIPFFIPGIIGCFSLFVMAILIIVKGDSNQSNDTVLLVGTFGIMVLFLLCGIKMVSEQKKYLNLYQKKINPKPPIVPIDYSQNYIRLTLKMYSLVWIRQKDKELENTRERVVKWWWITILIMTIVSFIPAIISIL